MNEAIKRATRGGWLPFVDTEKAVEVAEPARGLVWAYEKDGTGAGFTFNDVVLDPLFWQALGRHEGWGAVIKGSLEQSGMKFHTKKWKAYWHDFTDHIAEGKDIDSFFDSILKGGISS